MAQINKLKKDVAGVSTTVYPVTVPQAVINPATNRIHGYDEEEAIASDLNTLAERVNALEYAFRQMTLSKVQADTVDVLVNLNYQGRPLIIVAAEAPSSAPDGVPQFYVNTANGDLYSAKNSASVADWILK